MKLNFYDKVFACLFVITKSLHDKVGGALMYYKSFFAVNVLTSILLINISSIVLYWAIPPITLTYALDALLAAIFLYTYNAYRFFYKERYKNVVEEFKKNKPETNAIWVICTIAYAAVSVFLFYKVHSNTFFPE